MKTKMDIPDKEGRKRLVIVGGGFGGLKLARKLKSNKFQIVLLDKNNHHIFQPLLYQVATAGIEPVPSHSPSARSLKEENISIYAFVRHNGSFPKIIFWRLLSGVFLMIIWWFLPDAVPIISVTTDFPNVQWH